MSNIDIYFFKTFHSFLNNREVRLKRVSSCAESLINEPMIPLCKATRARQASKDIEYQRPGHDKLMTHIIF